MKDNNNNLKKIKEYEVKILDYLVSICKKNDLSYFLAYGTLLGAVRHKGFIPWDDDIDIYMPPADYYKLKEIMKEERNDDFFYQSLETEKYYNLLFSKIRMNNTLAVEKKSENEKIHKGIYIDIFPLVPYPNDKKDQTKMNKYLKILHLLIEADLVNKNKYNSNGKFGKILSKFLKFIPRNLRNIFAKKILKNIILYNGEYDNYICIIDNLIFSKKYFEESTYVSFEGKKYKSPKDYDKYLTSVYGDYMTLPKEEDRITHSFVKVSFDVLKEQEKIDFVICWVDGNDPKWQKEKNKYDTTFKKSGVNGIVRYRDWDNLKYWFRSVEKYAPWVNKIYFITWGHIPNWLNVDNPKLVIVNHKDYIPEKYLPTFSSNPIILNINKIKGLSEQFVFFNDDMFLLNKVEKEDFFKNGLPVDNYNEVNLNFEGENSTFANMMRNNYRIINKYYNKRKTILKRPFKYINLKNGLKRNIQTIKTTIFNSKFVGITTNHICQPYLKSYFDKVWDLEEKVLDETSSNKFRTDKDVTEWLIRYFQLLDGAFVPQNYKLGKYFAVSNNNQELINCIEMQKYKMICINDSDKSIDFEKCKEEINASFEKILSEKSTFEK